MKHWLQQDALHAFLWLAASLLLAAGPLAAKKKPQAPVDINTASAAELAQLPGIGPSRAAQIVRLREKNGPFRSVYELRALPRLSEKQFLELKQYTTTGSSPRPKPNAANAQPQR
jgi:competence protein ComEA